MFSPAASRSSASTTKRPRSDTQRQRGGMTMRAGTTAIAVLASLVSACSGGTGPPGDKGDKGDQGDMGTMGTMGIPGVAHDSLLRTTPEAAGVNCAAGGTKLEVGTDLDDDGVLDANEIDVAETSFVCNGADGAAGQSVTIAAEAAGVNCSAGGTRLTVGVMTTYACNGIAGPQGATGPQGPPGTGLSPQRVAMLHWYDANAGITFPSGGTTPRAMAFDGANMWIANSNGTIAAVR